MKHRPYRLTLVTVRKSNRIAIGHPPYFLLLTPYSLLLTPLTCANNLQLASDRLRPICVRSCGRERELYRG